MSAKTKKNKNIFTAYFTPFGLRQICDILIFASIIVIFVGIFTVDLVTVIGFSLFALACVLAMFRAIRVMVRKDINKRSPEYKNALINVIIMGILLIIAVLGILFSTIW